MRSMLVIALGAAIGANLRYAISLWATQRFGSGFPFGTLIINLAGSFAIGLVMIFLLSRSPMPETLRLFTVTGLLGGFTTFSSFSYEAFMLASAGQWQLAASYVFASIGGGLVGVVLGVAVGRAVF